eukprot:GHVT01064732.1.p1 GENE.GHVT01064732.1~~GHVT01064732.1.p1  ORF type:complete len:131 (-),score=10.07 GHVT01064732.1:1279-1671(-)
MILCNVIRLNEYFFFFRFFLSVGNNSNCALFCLFPRALCRLVSSSRPPEVVASSSSPPAIVKEHWWSIWTNFAPRILRITLSPKYKELRPKMLFKLITNFPPFHLKLHADDNATPNAIPIDESTATKHNL